jgi:predicted transcriptional regulator
MEESDPDDPDEILALETRKQIFEYIHSNPGVHFSRLKRELSMETGLLQYHLRELEDHGVIESRDHQDRRRLFVAQELDEEERSLLSWLRYETTRHILLYLMKEGPKRNRDIAEVVGVTPATVSWHVSQLLDAGVIEAVTEERTTRYRVADEELTMQLLVRYRESFVDRAVDNLIDFWG